MQAELDDLRGGRTRQGAVKKGELTAKTRDEAAEQLRKQQVIVTSLEERAGTGRKFKLSLGSGLSQFDPGVYVFCAGLTVPDGSVAWRVGLSPAFATGKTVSIAPLKAPSEAPS